MAKEARYQITPKGLINLEDRSDKVWDAIELYCYRYGYNAILVDKNGGQFINVRRANEKKNRK